ncbi:MAG: AAA family ATPase [Deltaproteobacteria bacterium]|nr:AAA family ATPase [Deltaproteobacteria bacterium]
MEQGGALAAERDGERSIQGLMDGVNRVLLDKADVVELVTLCMVSGGHVLLEDVPGVGKTTLAKALARASGATFRRIQFTSDMLPADVIGVSVFDAGRGQFVFNPGPIFAQMLLADEINRTPPRTQSALLEAMSEGQVTVDNVTRPLPQPYFVLATQNPLELHGTYPLPESQMDRFMMSLSMGYPSDAVERAVLVQEDDDRRLADLPVLAGPADLERWRRSSQTPAVKDSLVAYIQAILHGTRVCPEVQLGASPRAGIQLLRAVRARAWIRGRPFVTPDDVRALAVHVLAHRLWLRGERTGGRREQARNVLARIVESVPLP